MSARDISGVWVLRSFQSENIETGELTQPFGTAARGVLMLHADGRMVALVTPGEQAAPRTQAEQAAAFQNLVAYSGRYRLEPPDQFVTTVDVSWFQPWLGTEQARAYVLRGDTLDIISAPIRTPTTGDALVRGVLTWVRESA